MYIVSVGGKGKSRKFAMESQHPALTCIESFNRTLRKECLGWLKYRKEQLSELQARVNAFLRFYNTERPHLSLEMSTPTDRLSHVR